MSRVNVSEFAVTDDMRSMNTKTREQKRVGGTLENWALFKWWGSAHAGYVICGDVFGDSGWRDGDDLRTSLIVNIDVEKNEAETLNTIYKLGKPALSEEELLKQFNERVVELGKAVS
jgi:hypothetical protein